MTIRLCPVPACPEASGLDEKVGARVEHEVVIPGCSPVLADRACDVGADVVLLLAGQDGTTRPSGATMHALVGYTIDTH